MSRNYRRRSYKRRGNSSGGIAGFLLIGGLVTYSYGASFDAIFVYAVYGLLVIAALLAVVAVFKLWRWWRKKQQKLTVRYLQEEAITMTGLEFERYIAELMRKLGYTKVQLTEHYDLGVDIIAHKDGVKWGVQVKRCSGMVKAAAVRQVVTALRKYNCDRAMVVTNGFYSRPAEELAISNDCLLVDGRELSGWLGSDNAAQKRVFD